MKKLIVHLILVVLVIINVSCRNKIIMMKWSKKNKMPEPRYLGVAVECNGKIYYIGGRNAQNKDQSSVFEFDPQTNHWSVKTNMSSPRAHMAATVVDNKIYVIGGSIPHANEIYDPLTDTWEEGEPLITPRCHVGGAVLNKNIYIIGGNMGEGNRRLSDKNEMFNTATRKWESKCPLPVPMDARIAVLNNTLYAFGWNQLKFSVYTYDEANDSWSGINTTNPSSRFGAEPVSLNNSIYLIGGSPLNEGSDIVNRYDSETEKWIQINEMPFKALITRGVSYDGKLFIFGGFNRPKGTLNVMDYVFEGSIPDQYPD